MSVPNFNWRCEWKLEELLRKPHHTHKAYFHYAVDHGAENGWIMKSHLMEVSETMRPRTRKLLELSGSAAWVSEGF